MFPNELFIRTCRLYSHVRPVWNGVGKTAGAQVVPAVVTEFRHLTQMFMQRLSFVECLVMRDLTTRSAASFGASQLAACMSLTSPITLIASDARITRSPHTLCQAPSS